MEDVYKIVDAHNKVKGMRKRNRKTESAIIVIQVCYTLYMGHVLSSSMYKVLYECKCTIERSTPSNILVSSI